MTENVQHASVLVNEVIASLRCNERPNAVYLDCTVGLGGHTEAILSASSPSGRVIGLDRDAEALQLASKRVAPFAERVTLCHADFVDLSQKISALGLSEVDGILFDFGISSWQLDCAERGFSFQLSGPLDMRMDRSLPRNAADLVNTLCETDLANLIYGYGEERQSRRIAFAIVRYRKEQGPVTRTDELASIICRAMRVRPQGKRIHPATRTFLALRIAVNDELRQIHEALSQAVSLLAVGGRLVVISFHSLEDRPVKHCFRDVSQGARSDTKRFINLYKKPMVPTREEMLRNPRARSAKLRALERVA